MSRYFVVGCRNGERSCLTGPLPLERAEKWAARFRERGLLESYDRIEVEELIEAGAVVPDPGYGPNCRHCGAPLKSKRIRGLCYPCYYRPGVRELYPSTSKFSNAARRCGRCGLLNCRCAG